MEIIFLTGPSVILQGSVPVWYHVCAGSSTHWTSQRKLALVNFSFLLDPGHLFQHKYDGNTDHCSFLQWCLPNIEQGSKVQYDRIVKARFGTDWRHVLTARCEVWAKESRKHTKAIPSRRQRYMNEDFTGTSGKYSIRRAARGSQLRSRLYSSFERHLYPRWGLNWANKSPESPL
jgi:hypothetical protein